MKKTSLFVVFAFVLAVFSVFCLTSCNGDKTGRHDFERTMLADFEAEIDYLIDFDGNPLSGNAKITKGSILRLDVLSPDPYSGISIECDVSGEAEMISIAYSGIKAEVPKAAMEKLVFLMNMMSEGTAFAIEKQKGKDFIKCEEMYSSEELQYAEPYEVMFNHDGTDYIFIYDSVTGIPLEIFGDNGYCKAEIKVKKLKTEDAVSEE